MSKGSAMKTHDEYAQYISRLQSKACTHASTHRLTPAFPVDWLPAPPVQRLVRSVPPPQIQTEETTPLSTCPSQRPAGYSAHATSYNAATSPHVDTNNEGITGDRHRTCKDTILRYQQRYRTHDTAWQTRQTCSAPSCLPIAMPGVSSPPPV